MTGGPGLAPTPLGLAPVWRAKPAPAPCRPLSASWPGIRAALVVAEPVLMAFAALVTSRLYAHWRPDAALVIIMAVPFAALPLWLYGRYRIDHLTSMRSAVITGVSATAFGGGLAVLGIQITPGAGSAATLSVVGGWLIIGSVVLLFRATVSSYLREQLVLGRLDRHVAILEPSGAADAARLAIDLARTRGQPCHLSFLQIPSRNRAGWVEQVAARVRELGPDEILIVAGARGRGGAAYDPLFNERSRAHLLERLGRLRWPTTLASAPLGEKHGFVFTTLIEPPLTDSDRLIKRACDIIGASLLLLIVLPLFALLALAIKLDSAGPVFFRQQRRGLDNELFDVLKFRTMHGQMCDPFACRLTTRNDPRVTRVGSFLRRWSLDELPQLLNVLRGTMSLVGPRPHPLQARAGERLYEEVVADFALRYRVKPGMTGWAQVHGLRGNTDSEDKLVRRFEYDMEYIRNWSIWLDLKILVRTPLASVLGENAY